MARIQILDLPDEETPDGNMVTRFALVLDQYDEPIAEHTARYLTEFRERCGACALVVFPGVVDIDSPAVAQIGTVSVKVEPDLDGFETAITAAIERAERAIVDAVRPKIGVTPGFAAPRARRTEEFLDKGPLDPDGQG